MAAYYNEIDPFAAQWLRELIDADLIAPGDVDQRPIQEVTPDDLAGYTQHHFFAGIGVWSYALRCAGWPDDREVWTGSCPCQPFSAAGKQRGFDDNRHLWPYWFPLIAVCEAPVVFGEQVASALAWFDVVHADLENAGYAVGVADLCAAGVGAPHIRQRLYFVADAGSERRQQVGRGTPRDESAHGRQPNSGHVATSDGEALLMGDTADIGRSRRRERNGSAEARDGGAPPIWSVGREQTAERCAPGSFWAGAEWIRCHDGRSRPVEPGTFPLAHGAPARVGRLRGYGNALVAPLAATFIKAYLTCA